MSKLSTKEPQNLIRIFISGSLLVLLLFLFVAAGILSTTFLKREDARAKISMIQLQSLFNAQNRYLVEEVWTKNYESVGERVKKVAEEFGNSQYDMTLVDEKGECVFGTNGSTTSVAPCESPKVLDKHLPNLMRVKTNSPITTFDESTQRYVYMYPVDIGPIRKGYLFASMTDPYGFYRGTSFKLIFQFFAPAIIGILLLWLVWLFISRKYILQPYLDALVDFQKKQALWKMAAQLGHDIRSPLAAMKRVVDTPQGLEEGKIKLLRASFSRIESLADDLLVKHQNPDAVSGIKFAFVLPVIESIVAEKNAALGELSKIDISVESKVGTPALGVPISTNDFSRVISNIMSNSIEALKGVEQGKISIVIQESLGKVKVEISDNGQGIPSDVLQKIRTIGGSHGKEAGFGMGLSHAKTTLAHVQGCVSINSKFGEGTAVILEIPLAPNQDWVTNHISIKPTDKIVVLEDDDSVTLLWKEKLQNYQVTYLQDPEEFDIRLFPPSEYVYLLDHESVRSKVRGIDLINSNRLGNRAILVTSHFNDPKLQNAVILAGSKMLPKFMISRIDVISDATPNLDVVSQQPHAVLIDDNYVNHLSWQDSAEELGIRLLTLREEEDLKKYGVSSTTPIFVDKQLANSISGVDVAVRFHEKGYENLYISTGECIPSLKLPPFLKGIIGKEFPTDMFKRFSLKSQIV